MEPNNMQNDNVGEPLPVRAPGFANGDAASGDASDVVAPVNGGNDVVFQDKPKKSHGMLYGMILLAILAAGGIGFGVWAMLDENSRAQKKDEQISQLQSQLSDLSNQIAEANNETKDEADDVVDTDGGIDKEADLNGDIALDLLQEASVGKQLGYGVGYANVHARCENDGKVSYWIQYANGHRVSEDAPQFGNIMFEMGDDGTWQFELPGFTGYTEELVANCTILHGDK